MVKLNKKYLTIAVFIFVLMFIGVVIYASFLSAPADKITNNDKFTGNLILGRFNPADYKLNTVGEVIKKDTGEVINKRTYNSQTYANSDNTYTAESI